MAAKEIEARSEPKWAFTNDHYVNNVIFGYICKGNAMSLLSTTDIKE